MAPQRHGALLSAIDEPLLRLGIKRVFDPWIDPNLLVEQGYNVSHPERRPLAIEYHFRRVAMRLVISLGRFYQQARNYDKFLESGGIAGPHPERVFNIPEEAGIAADSVFHYLNLFIDDVARIIPFVLAEEGNKPIKVEGFGDFRDKIINKKTISAPQPLFDLFDNLKQEGSWHSLGFKRGVGMRQRLTHYTSLVSFSASTKAGDTNMTADISLISIGDPTSKTDFESTLQIFLTNLCEWLDQLDQVLLSHLSEKLARKDIIWNPLNEPIPDQRLPDCGDIRPDASHYLYLPVCR